MDYGNPEAMAALLEQMNAVIDTAIGAPGLANGRTLLTAQIDQFGAHWTTVFNPAQFGALIMWQMLTADNLAHIPEVVRLSLVVDALK
jgi:hypothetical protein